MLRLRLIHWDDASRYITLLTKAGHRVEHSPEFSPRLIKDWRVSPPDAFVIDLSRQPSHGREIATALRQYKDTRAVPLVFCEGEPEKVAKTREFLPDATFCSFSKLKSAIRAAVNATPKTPVIPVPMMDRYSGRTTAQKLGIRTGDTVALVDHPRDMPNELGPLPDGVKFVEGQATVTLLFATDPVELRRGISEFRSVAAKSKLWVCWKKGKAAAETGVNEDLIRKTGIALGLVDYKVCSGKSDLERLALCPPKMKPTFFATPAAWRAWLERNHAKHTELLVGFYKKESGTPSITWPESVDAALSFGWIDGVRRRIDDVSYTIRFTPRKPTSIWSAVNIKRAEELVKQNLMHAAGFKAFSLRTEKRSRIYAFEQEKVEFTTEQEHQFKANRPAWAFFQRQPAFYRRVQTWRVISAKREETRQKRLANLLAASERGERLP